MGVFTSSFTTEEIEQQVMACTGCYECLRNCPTMTEPISVGALNSQTLAGPITHSIARFTRACTQCGACVSVCPVGLHRDAMMLWLKVRLLRSRKEHVHPVRRRWLPQAPSERAHHIW